jgi:hypothetical protein
LAAFAASGLYRFHINLGHALAIGVAEAQIELSKSIASCRLVTGISQQLAAFLTLLGG